MRALLLVPVAIAALLGTLACNASPEPASDTTAASAASASDTAAAAAAPAAQAPQAPAVRNAFSGTIAESMNSGGYTYARLQGGPEDVWIAATEFDAKVGERVSVALDMPMRDFESKTMKRTFPLLYFVSDVARNGQPLTPTQAAPPSLMTSHGAVATGSADDAPAAAPVAKVAPPAGGLSIADVIAKRAALSGKTVKVSGTVVKFNGGIMDRNWLHLQDGSGSADTHDNDLTITTSAEARVGDVVTATGVLKTNQDFGAGYAYEVIVEQATIAPR